MSATLDIDEQEEEIGVWLRIPVESADLEGFTPLASRLEASARQHVGRRYRISVVDPFDPECKRTFELRRWLSGGMNVELFFDADLFRMRMKLSSRLDLLWALVSLGAGCGTWIFLAFSFWFGMWPHGVARFGGTFGFIPALVVTIVVGSLTWYPLRLWTRRARGQSFEDGKRLIRALVETAEKLLAQHEAQHEESA